MNFRWARSLAIVVTLCAPAFGEEDEESHERNDRDKGRHEMGYDSEIENVMREYRDRPIGELTFAELDEMMAQLSVPQQKAAYVRRSSFASRMLPGLGQFKNGATGLGVLFLVSEIAISAGSMVGSYLLLPESVMQGVGLDYLNDSFTEIETAWNSLSLSDIAPAMGIMAAGVLLDAILRFVSAKHAGRLARQRVDSGGITFAPRVGLDPSHGISLAFGSH